MNYKCSKADYVIISGNYEEAVCPFYFSVKLHSLYCSKAINHQSLPARNSVGTFGSEP